MHSQNTHTHAAAAADIPKPALLTGTQQCTSFLQFPPQANTINTRSIIDSPSAEGESEPGDLSRVHSCLSPSGSCERPQHPVISGRQQKIDVLPQIFNVTVGSAAEAFKITTIPVFKGAADHKRPNHNVFSIFTCYWCSASSFHILGTLLRGRRTVRTGLLPRTDPPPRHPHQQSPILHFS